MTTQSDWLSEIGAACDDLGYGIEYMEPGRVSLRRLRKSDALVVIESVFLSGALLRELLLPVPPMTVRRAPSKGDKA